MVINLRVYSLLKHMAIMIRNTGNYSSISSWSQWRIINRHLDDVNFGEKICKSACEDALATFDDKSVPESHKFALHVDKFHKISNNKLKMVSDQHSIFTSRSFRINLARRWESSNDYLKTHQRKTRKTLKQKWRHLWFRWSLMRNFG